MGSDDAEVRSLHRKHHAAVFDPGQSTGIVLADWPVADINRTPPPWDSVVWTSCTIPDTHLRDWLAERGTRFVRECAACQESITVIVERPPHHAKEPGGAARLIREWIGGVGCVVETILVSPGEWKPWVKANPLPKGTKTGSQHERDAVNILRWHLAHKRG